MLARIYAHLVPACMALLVLAVLGLGAVIYFQDQRADALHEETITLTTERDGVKADLETSSRNARQMLDIKQDVIGALTKHLIKQRADAEELSATLLEIQNAQETHACVASPAVAALLRRLRDSTAAPVR